MHMLVYNKHLLLSMHGMNINVTAIYVRSMYYCNFVMYKFVLELKVIMNEHLLGQKSLSAND